MKNATTTNARSCSARKTAAGRKTIKERITFPARTNGNGSHILKPLVVGKARNPRAFKNKNLLWVLFSKSAWMTSSIIKD